MRRHGSLNFALAVGFAVTAATSLATQAGAQVAQPPVALAPTIVGAEQRLLLVFGNGLAEGRPGARYRVTESAADAAMLGQHMNEMASEGYSYRAAIPISHAPVPLPQAVGVPGLTPNVLGQGSAAGSGRPELLLLVFYRARGLNDYRVIESSTQAEHVERRLNDMAPEGFHCHTAFVLSDTVVGDAPRGGSSTSIGVGVPGFTSNVLGDGIILPNGDVRIDATPWVRRPGSDSRYRVLRAGTWAECEAKAREHGAHLVTVNDAEEQAWLTETYGGQFVWIGLTDEGAEGVWRWASGEEPGYTNWAAATHEPSNQWEGGEHFVHMNWTQDGQWNDLGPSSPEWPAVTHGIVEKSAAE